MIVKPQSLKFTHRLYADEWAEQNVFLKDSGRFSYAVTPFFREPTRCASDLIHTCRVILKTPAQVGKSQTLLNIIGWMSVFDAANSLIIMDSLKTAQRFSKNRLKPFLRDSCSISAFDRSAKDRSKETCNISLSTGANLLLGSSASASDLCSTPVKWLFCDELDRWVDEIDGEGDPLLLAFKRQLSFLGMAVLTSTPTRPDGRIQAHYELGTQETWCVSCHCGECLRVSYDDIDFSGSTPFYSCKNCGECFSEKDIIALPHLYAPPKNATPFTDKHGRVARSFEVTATLCHAQYTWDSLKKEEMQAKSLGEAAIRSFRNTSLGETYTPPEQEILSSSVLVKLASAYTESSLPEWVSFLVCGVDTQDRAFVYTILGFDSEMRRMAFVKANIIFGDLRTPAPWNELKILFNSYRASTKDGRCLGVTAVAIDSGGHFTQDVYALSMLSPRILAVKGRSHNLSFEEKCIIDRTISVSVKAIGTGIGRTRLTFINTRFCKDLIYNHLSGKIHDTAYGAEWIWSNSPEAGLNDDFFHQLTSEVRTYNTAGNYIYERIPNRENHFLDSVVYGLGAAEAYRLFKGAIPALEPALSAVEQPTSQPIEKAPSAVEQPTQPPTKKKIILPVKSQKKAL